MPAAVSRRARPLLALVPLLAGCACTDLDHLALTNLIDRGLVPDHPVAQEVVAPVLVPVGALTLALDNLLVAPVVHLPSALGDARWFWELEAGGYYTELAVLPVRACLTPVVAIGSWMGRSLFGIEPREDARWGWPVWGEAWVRDEDGRLLGSSRDFDPVTKRRRPPPTAAPAAGGGA